MAASSGDRVRKHRAKLAESVDVVQVHEPDTWRESRRYIEAGYLPQPIWRQDIEALRECSPHVQWLPPQANFVPASRVDDAGISIACSLELRTAEVETVDGTKAVMSWAPVPTIAALRLSIPQSHDLVAYILSTIIRPRLTWAPDVVTRLMPTRSKLGSAEILIPLRQDRDAHMVDFSTDKYSLPTDVGPENRYMPGPVNSASIRSVREIFLASSVAHRWSDGGIPAVTRASLPMLATVGDAREIIRIVEAELDTRGTRLTYQPIQVG